MKILRALLNDNTYVDGDVKVRDYCQINEKYTGSA